MSEGGARGRGRPIEERKYWAFDSEFMQSGGDDVAQRVCQKRFDTVKEKRWNKDAIL